MDDDREDEPAPPKHPLLAPLDAGQQLLVDLVFERAVVPGQQWPVYDYLVRTMRKAGQDADRVLLSFPVAENQNNPSLRYRHFFTAGNGGAAQRRDARIHLTIAGLSTAEPPGPAFANFLTGMIAVLARRERDIVPDPDAEVSHTFDLDDIVHSVPGFQQFDVHLPLFASVLEHEVPLWGSTWPREDQSGTPRYNIDLRSDLTAFVGTDGIADYLSRLLEVMGSNRPVAAPAPLDVPLALVDEMGYLDAVWQARTKRSALFGAAQVSSCARLVLPCASPEDFDSRMNALYDVLNRIEVPITEDAPEMKGRMGSLQRLRAQLLLDLPDDDAARVDESIKALRAAVSVRAALHTGRQRDLPRAYEALGLTFPPQDYGRAWDHVRGRCSWAIRSIRQALETLP